MGMFDTIKVPVSYLRNVLDKKDEKYFDSDTDFQTKDLDCIMGEYKIYRRQLFRRKFLRDEFETKVDTEWIKEEYTGDVNFYTLIRDDEETEYIFDFKFSFKNGKLDTKELLRKEYLASKEEREDQDRMYDIEQSFFDDYRSRLSYRFWNRVHIWTSKVNNYIMKKIIIPKRVKNQAYHLSGRAEKNPACLEDTLY